MKFAMWKDWRRRTSPESLQTWHFISLQEEKANRHCEKPANEHLHFVNNCHGRTVFCYSFLSIFISSSSPFMTSWLIYILSLPKHTFFFFFLDCCRDFKTPGTTSICYLLCKRSNCSSGPVPNCTSPIPAWRKQANKTKQRNCHSRRLAIFQSPHMLRCPHFKRGKQFLHTVKKKDRVNIMTGHVLACKQSVLSVFPWAFKQCML